MADVAFRSGDLAFQPRRFWRGRASGRGGSDRFAPRTEGVVDRARGEGSMRPVPWPVVPRRDASFDVMVAPSSTIPAVVALPRVTTAAPVTAPDDADAPAIRIAADARCPLPVDLRRRGLGVVAAMVTHLLCLAALLAMPRIEASGGGLETEAVEIAIVFAEASLDAEAGAVSAPREATPEPMPPQPVPPEPLAAEPPPLAPPSDEAAVALPLAPVPPEPAADPAPPEPVRLAEPEPPPPPEEPQVLATAAPAETAVPPPPVVTPPPEPPAVRVDPPKPEPPAKPKPQPAKAERRAVAKPRATAPAPPGNAARDSTSGARSAGAAPAAGAGAVADWRAAVLAALARAKRYPDDARDRGVTGRAVVAFTLSRDGSVTAVSLVTSSGVPALDAATLAMPRRAAFPPMPAGGPQTQSFTAGVRYDLR